MQAKQISQYGETKIICLYEYTCRLGKSNLYLKMHELAVLTRHRFRLFLTFSLSILHFSIMSLSIKVFRSVVSS